MCSASLRRVATFSEFPVSKVSCLQLARRGFAYGGQSDHLLCQHCGAKFSGWLETQRNPSVEHDCPSVSSTTEEFPLRGIRRDHRRRSTMDAIFDTAIQRATSHGVLEPAEARDLLSRDLSASGHQAVTSGDDGVISGEIPGSVVPNDERGPVLKLKLSLAKRHLSFIGCCPLCVRCWWYTMYTTNPFFM